MLPTQGLKARLYRAVKRVEFEQGHKLAQDDLGEAVAKSLGERPSQQSVSSWLTRGTGKLDIVWALALALGVRPAWLAFGEEPMVRAVESSRVIQELPPEMFEPLVDTRSAAKKAAAKAGGKRPRRRG